MNRPLSIGDLSLELPDGWEEEVDLVWRAPAIDGYRPNVRLTYRSSDSPEPVAALARASQDRLSGGLEGSVELTQTAGGELPGADDMADLRFAVDVGAGRTARHRVLIATRGRTVITVAASHREGDDDAIESALMRVLASVRLS